MKSKHKRHIKHYLALTAILLAGLILFAYFSYDANFQLIVSAVVAIAYVIWGIVHHKIHDDLHLSVVIEYVAVAILGIVIVTSLVLRT